MSTAVIVVDEDILTRESVCNVLAGRGFAVESFARFSDAVSALRKSGGVLFYHAPLGFRRSAAFLDAIRRPEISSKLVLRTRWLNNPDRHLLMRHAVAGLLTSECGIADLLQAIESAALGRPLNAVAEKHPSGSRSSPSLSAQELRATELAVEGLANKEIAVRMGVSESHVKGLLQRTFLKVGVRSRAELMRTWLDGSMSERRPGR